MSEANILPAALLTKFVVAEGGCWIWTAAVDRHGYGRVSIGGKKGRLAYRYVYELIVGPVESGRELDHLCRQRACINPAHLEPVSHQENVARGSTGEVNAARQLARTRCKHGHEYGTDNVYVDTRGSRNCRTCLRRNRAKRRTV
jgi:hypothetical protein